MSHWVQVGNESGSAVMTHYAAFALMADGKTHCQVDSRGCNFRYSKENLEAWHTELAKQYKTVIHIYEYSYSRLV